MVLFTSLEHTNSSFKARLYFFAMPNYPKNNSFWSHLGLEWNIATTFSFRIEIYLRANKI